MPGIPLTKKQQEALGLRLKGYTAVRVAEMLAIHPDRVRRLWVRGLKRLSESQRDAFYMALKRKPPRRVTAMQLSVCVNI